MPFSGSCDVATPLEIASRELGHVRERLLAAALSARSLGDLTHWNARAAEAFRVEADAWAGDVSGIGCLVETARLTVQHARDRVLFEDLWRECG